MLELGVWGPVRICADWGIEREYEKWAVKGIDFSDVPDSNQNDWGVCN